MNDLTLRWREPTSNDRGFILNSWLRGYHEHGAEFRSVVPPVYFAIYQPVVKRMLERSRVTIASDADIPDTVIGYMVIEGHVLHWFLVHPKFRRFGVARWMMRGIPDAVTTYTHRPSAVASRLLEPTWGYDATLRPFEASHVQEARHDERHEQGRGQGEGPSHADDRSDGDLPSGHRRAIGDGQRQPDRA